MKVYKYQDILLRCLIALLGLCLFYKLYTAILPFLIAFIFSYLLEPLVRFLNTRCKLSRSLSVLGVFVLFSGLVSSLLLLGLPVLYKQISLLLIKVPAYKQYLQLKLIPEIVSQFQGIDPVVGERIGEAIQSVTNDLLNLIIRVVQNLWGYTLATVNVAAFIFFVPIIMIYLLRDWRAIIETFKKSENLNLGEEVWIVISDINKSLSSYIRGQLNVCAIMILFYSGTLSVLSLDGALLIGIFSGIAIIVPIVGTVAAFATSLLVGFLSFGYSSELYYIVFIYATGHIIESYIVSPKIIGDKIGVHPLWIMFSVLASGELLGFIGILFAVPIASILNVLISYVVRVFSSKTIEKL